MLPTVGDGHVTRVRAIHVKHTSHKVAPNPSFKMINFHVNYSPRLLIKMGVSQQLLSLLCIWLEDQKSFYTINHHFRIKLFTQSRSSLSQEHPAPIRHLQPVARGLF